MHTASFPISCCRVLAFWALALSLTAQSSDSPTAPVPAARFASHELKNVLHQAMPDGCHWVAGNTYKAGFDADGFTYVPNFGARAPRNFPVRFRVVSLRVGEAEVAVGGAVLPSVRGDEVAFRRGALTEVYELAVDRVEQKFVVDTRLAGDIVLEVAVDSELQEDELRPGLQWANEFGRVDYSEAFVVRGVEKLPIDTTRNGQTLRLTVPASLRCDGPVVVDPILQTVPSTFLFSLLWPANVPDVSYDATTGRTLAVWERVFSATDGDVLSEMFDSDGDVLPGSGVAVDISSGDARGPRVANLNATDRFLVVYQHRDMQTPGQSSKILGRFRNAASPTAITPSFVITSPLYSGDSATPDVGGDPSDTASAFGFAVVWTQQLPTGGVVHIRGVASTGQFSTPDEELSVESGHPQFSPQISHSNGRGQMQQPGWLVVYSRSDNGDFDVAGNFVSPTFQVGPRLALDYGAATDFFPFVSSPCRSPSGATHFLVTYERQQPQAARALLVDAATGLTIASSDLTQTHGIGPLWTRGDSDGVRFVVAASVGQQAIGLSTLAFDGSQLVVHETAQVLPGTPAFPHLVAHRACGGTSNRYSVVFQDSSAPQVRTTLTTYRSRSPGLSVVMRPTSCEGLLALSDGDAALGETVQFHMPALGGAIPGFALGLTAPTPIAICAQCRTGIRLDQPITTVFGNSSLFLPIPPDPTLVGAQVTVQGLAIGGGHSCLGFLALSDSFDLTIR